MLLDARLEGELHVLKSWYTQGKKYFEATLISDDGQTLHLYEGQLKEVDDQLVEDARYRVVFRPFVNNRWIQLKIETLELIATP